MKDIGLVLVQHSPPVVHEPLISGVEHGLEEVLIRSGMRLVIRVVADTAAELDVYQHWHRTESVDAVVLVGLTRTDSRIDFLEKLRVPFAAIADKSQLGAFSAVAIDTAGTMKTLIAHLADRGHRSMVFVSDSEPLELSAERSRAFLSETASLGFDGRVVSAELSGDGGRTATRDIVSGDDRPTAIIYDDDITAAAGILAIQELGLVVPDDIAVAAWNDSVRCQSSRPSITAMSNEAHSVGMLVGECLIATVDSGEPIRRDAPASFIVERQST